MSEVERGRILVLAHLTTHLVIPRKNPGRCVTLWRVRFCSQNCPFKIVSDFIGASKHLNLFHADRYCDCLVRLSEAKTKMLF